MPKENKQMLELGSKQRAGMLISAYLRAVGDEKTELIDVVVGPDKIKRKICSKAEALARDMFEQALRCSDTKMRLEYRKLILDRIEGRAATGLTGGDIDHPNRNVPDRISEINKNKLNKLAKNAAKKES